MSEEFFRKHGPLTFANILWSFRLCDEMSQKAYARKLRISPANLCDLEKGRKVPSPRRAAAIAKRIGLSETLLVEVALQDYLRKNKLHYRVSLAA
jgi:transcriptional regulator with XRE-family HTH domain